MQKVIQRAVLQPVCLVVWHRQSPHFDHANGSMAFLRNLCIYLQVYMVSYLMDTVRPSIHHTDACECKKNVTI
jgi:hypothetical protein